MYTKFIDILTDFDVIKKWQNCAQFTWDFYDQMYSELSECEEYDEDVVGSLLYRINCIIDIIDEALLDFKYFKELAADLEKLQASQQTE